MWSISRPAASRLQVRVMFLSSSMAKSLECCRACSRWSPKSCASWRRDPKSACLSAPLGSRVCLALTGKVFYEHQNPVHSYETRAISSAVERLLHTQEVTGSNPVSRTTPLCLSFTPQPGAGTPRGAGSRCFSGFSDYARSKRSRFMTLLQAAIKSWTNFFPESAVA